MDSPTGTASFPHYDSRPHVFKNSTRIHWLTTVATAIVVAAEEVSSELSDVVAGVVAPLPPLPPPPPQATSTPHPTSMAQKDSVPINAFILLPFFRTGKFRFVHPYRCLRIAETEWFCHRSRVRHLLNRPRTGIAHTSR